MNENHTRGMLHCKLLTALAIATLLTGSNIALATETNSENINVITEQLRSEERRVGKECM